MAYRLRTMGHDLTMENPDIPAGAWPARETYDRITEVAAEVEPIPVPESAPPPPEGMTRALTAREIQILQLVAEGKSNLQIGEQLGLSRFTVKTHLERIADAMQVKNGRREVLVITALRSGLIH